MDEINTTLNFTRSPRIQQIVNTGVVITLEFEQGNALVIADVVENELESHTGFSEALFIIHIRDVLETNLNSDLLNSFIAQLNDVFKEYATTYSNGNEIKDNCHAIYSLEWVHFSCPVTNIS